MRTHIFVSSMIYDHLLHHVSRDIFHSRVFLANSIMMKTASEIEGFLCEGGFNSTTQHNLCSTFFH